MFIGLTAGGGGKVLGGSTSPVVEVEGSKGGRKDGNRIESDINCVLKPPK